VELLGGNFPILSWPQFVSLPCLFLATGLFIQSPSSPSSLRSSQTQRRRFAFVCPVAQKQLSKSRPYVPLCSRSAWNLSIMF